MAGSSLEILLSWMAVPSNNVMWGWDVIAALARNKTNTLLLQEYIARFTTGSYLPPISGEVEMVSGEFKEYIHEFLLDSPRLSFEDAHLDNSRATLTCSIVRGVQLSMANNVNTWQTVKVSEIDPLQGPRLTLQLFLPDVPGNVNDDGRVMLDLRNSDDFMLNFALTEHEQRLGGDFFKDLFNQLPDEKRIWTLGNIQRGSDELMHPQSFKLRTQANGQASRDPRAISYGDGAILVLMSMVGSGQGGLPSEDYPYLIPDDAGKNYSATVLFSREKIIAGVPVMGPLLAKAKALFQNSEFTPVYSEGVLVSAEAKRGELSVAVSSNWLPSIILDGKWVTPWIIRDKLVLPATGLKPFTLKKIESGEVSMSWKSEAVSKLVITLDERYGNVEQFWKYTIDFSTHYGLTSDGDKGMVIRPFDWTLNVTSELQENTNRFVGKSMPEEVWLILLAYLVIEIAALGMNEIPPQINKALKQEWAVDIPANSFIQDSIKLTFGQAIVGDTLRAPRDVGFFGQINPIRTSFLISPMERLMAAGATRDFTTDPVVDGVEWTVGAVEEEGLLRGARSAGSISPRGVYTAPAADSIDGRFTRVRVTATDKTSGHYSSALVTVLVNDLTINPLIQSCGYRQSVELAAGALGDKLDDELGEEELIWAIKNPVPGESGSLQPSELPEGDHVYVAGNQVPNKTYVLDEIEVTSKAGKTRSAWILVVQKEPMLKVKPVPEAGLPVGQIKLGAWGNDSPREPEWMLAPGSPGEIHSDGLYISDPAASHRFVLVFCKMDSPWGSAEGHIILPLPLDSFRQKSS